MRACGSCGDEVCGEVLAHFGPGPSQREGSGITEKIGTTRRSFKRETENAVGDQNNLGTRRGRLPSGIDHSLNLSGQRSRTRPGRPLFSRCPTKFKSSKISALRANSETRSLPLDGGVRQRGADAALDGIWPFRVLRTVCTMAAPSAAGGACANCN